MKCRLCHIALFVVLLSVYGCCVCDEKVQPELPILTFAVAGHVYGNPDTYTSSVYPPFLKQLKKDHTHRQFDFLFLTGDVVAHSNDTTWGNVKRELDSLNISWWIAPGNHDLGLGRIPTGKKTTKDYGPGGFYHFLKDGKNEFMLLNTSVPGWTVDSLQLLAIRKRLAEIDKNRTDNLFVFTHQLWWERNTPDHFELDSLRPNSMACYAGTSDFWQDVFPYFDSTGIETWFFAGDMGAWYTLPSYYEDHYHQFHFYGSGMGGGTEDNYLIVEVYQDGRVDIEKVHF